MHFLIKTVLADVGLSEQQLNEAFLHAARLYKQVSPQAEHRTEISERIRIICALSYRKGGRLCDFGSYINIYPVALALLGMRVTTVDYYPQVHPHSPYFNSDIPAILGIWRSVGIEVVEADLYDVVLRTDAYDIMTSFETFEHLYHSPKPIMQKMVNSLKAGGDVVVSVPNIVNLASRIKVLIGRSPLENYPAFFEHGCPFTGHRREMTLGEVHYMMSAVGLQKIDLFTADVSPPLGPNASAYGRLYRRLVHCIPLPKGFRSTIFAIYRKPHK